MIYKSQQGEEQTLFQLKISNKTDIHYTVINWMFDPRMDLLPEAAG